MKANKSFKEQYPFTKRLNEANRVLEKYTDRIPIIVERNTSTSNNLPIVDKKNFSSQRLNCRSVCLCYKKRIKLEPEKAIFLMINSLLPPTSMLLSDLYSEHKHEDNFLYITYSSENTFG